MKVAPLAALALLALAPTLTHAASPRHAPAGVPTAPAPRPLYVPPTPRYYIKAHDGSLIPVAPVFVVPALPPPSTPAPPPPCRRFFCD